MGERELMKVINVDGIEKCVRRLGFRNSTQISDIRLGGFVPNAFYDKAKRVLSTPKKDLNWRDKFYLWIKRDDLPSKEDAKGIVAGNYDINRMIQLNAAYMSGVGPHQIGVVEIERRPVEDRAKGWVEEARIELHEELDMGTGQRVPPLSVNLTYNERGNGRLFRADYALFPSRFERADFESYFPTAEIVRRGVIQ